MTTRELYELTRGHEGKPWWPLGLEYAECEICDGDPAPGLWTLEVGGIDIDHDKADDWKRSDEDDPPSAASILPATAAEWLIIGSAVKWLVEKRGDRGVALWHCGDHFHCVNSEHTQSYLAALLAACEAAGAAR